MKFIVRWLFRLLLLTLVLVVAALLLKDSILKEWAEGKIRRRTGLEAQIGRLEVNLFSPTISVEGFKLFNPPEFGGTPFIEVADAQIEYDSSALRSGRLHLRLLRAHLRELSVVRDAQGQSNWQSIRRQLYERSAAAGASSLAFDGIETLNLTLERVVAYQLGARTPPTVHNLGLRHEILRHLANADELERALLALAARLGLGPWFATPVVTNAGPPRTQPN